MGIRLLSALAVAAFAICAGADEAAVWKASIEPFKEKNSRLITVESGKLKVRFNENTAWTVFDIYFEGKQIGSPFGGTGAVVTWQRNDPWIAASDVSSWEDFKKGLDDSAVASPGAALKKRLPPEALKGTQASEEALKALDAALGDPGLFDAKSLDAIPEEGKKRFRTYAKKALAELKDLPQPVAKEAVAERNRKILELAFQGCFKPLSRPIGTVHGGEELKELSISIDGKELVLKGLKAPCPELTSGIAGKRLSVLKKSKIGPLVHEARFEFQPDGGSFTAKHSFLAGPEAAEGRYSGYRYTFMFMMPESFDRWVETDGDGVSVRTVLEKDAKAEQRQLKAALKSLACYSPELKTGVAYVFEKPYAGASHLDVRAGKDRKFRANLFAETCKPGQYEEYGIAVKPFSSAEDRWLDAAAEASKTEENAPERAATKGNAK